METLSFDQNTEQPAPDVLQIFRQVIAYSIQSGEGLDDFKARLEMELQARQCTCDLQQRWLEQTQDRLWKLFQRCPQAVADLGLIDDSQDRLRGADPKRCMTRVDLLEPIDPAVFQAKPAAPLDLIEAAARIVRLIRAELPESKAYSLQDALWLAFLALNGPAAAACALERYRVITPSK